MKKVLMWAGIGFVVLIVGITAIGAVAGDTETSASEPKTSAPKSEPAKAAATTEKPKKKPEVTAKDLEKYFVAALGKPIRKMCGADNAYSHWGCFYKDIDPYDDTSLEVTLTTDGGWSDDELDAIGESAARHWFNFLHDSDEYKKFTTIVVKVNGLDQNYYKRNYPYLKD